MLRLLMTQHQLGTADLPEIGSKSMVSRVLSGQRALNKKHIAALSKRFQVDPGLQYESNQQIIKSRVEIQQDSAGLERANLEATPKPEATRDKQLKS